MRARSQTTGPAAHAAACFGIEDGPAPGGQHQAIGSEQLGQERAFLGAEARFADGGKDFADRAARAALELGVGVDCGESQAARQ